MGTHGAASAAPAAAARLSGCCHGTSRQSQCSVPCSSPQQSTAYACGADGARGACSRQTPALPRDRNHANRTRNRILPNSHRGRSPIWRCSRTPKTCLGHLYETAITNHVNLPELCRPFAQQTCSSGRALIERQENDDPRWNTIALAAEQLKLNHQRMSAEKVFETEKAGNIMHQFPANATALESQKYTPQSKTQ